MASPQEIAKAASVTEAYARMLLAGTRRPSLEVALQIYDGTGAQFGPLAGLDADGVEVARRMVKAA